MSDARELERQRLSAEKSFLPKPVYALYARAKASLAQRLANTEFGTDIARGNPTYKAKVNALEEQVRIYAQRNYSPTETAQNMTRAQLLLVRGQPARAEELFDAVRNSSNASSIRVSGNEKVVLELEQDLFSDQVRAFEQARQYPMLYYLDSALVPVVIEVSSRFRKAGFGAIDIPNDGMRQWVRCPKLSFPTLEEYASANPNEISNLRRLLLDREAFAQSYLRDLATTQYKAIDKIVATAMQSSERISQDAIDCLKAIVVRQDNEAVFTDNHFDNNFRDTTASIYSRPNSALNRDAVIAFDFDTYIQRTSFGHAFVDASFKSNLKLAKKVSVLRMEYYSAVQFKPDERTRISEFLRLFRVVGRYSNKWPRGVALGTQYLADAFKKDLRIDFTLQPTVNSYVRFVNCYADQMARVMQ